VESVQKERPATTRDELARVHHRVANTIFRRCRHAHEKKIAALKCHPKDPTFQQQVDACLCDDSEDVGNCAHRVGKKRPNPFYQEALWMYERGLVSEEEVQECERDGRTIYDTDVDVNMVEERAKLIPLPVISDIALMEKVARDQDAMIEKLEHRQQHYLSILSTALSELPE
jgi:hypothetical protein